MNKTPVFTDKTAAVSAAAAMSDAAAAAGKPERFYASRVKGGAFAVRRAAFGPVSVLSRAGVECHANSGYRSNDFSGDNGARDRQRDMILAFWESQGVAQWRNGGAGGGGRWYVRDMVNGGAEWMPLSSGPSERDGFGEFSHVVSARNGGAWCACNLLPESGVVNAAREDANVTDLTPSARALLAAWPAYYRANVARKASLARLGA